MKPSSPTEIVDRHLSAYNQRDIEAYCALFARQAVVLRLNTGEVIARGIDAIRAYYNQRFTNPRLHCQIRARMQLGDFVVDHERVHGIGADVLEVIALYEVRESLIQSLRILWP